MSTPEQPLPAGGVRREEAAIAEIAHTDASRTTVNVLVVFFLIAISIVPLAEVIAVAVRGGQGLAVAWSHLSGIPSALGEMNSTSSVELGFGRATNWWDRILSGNRIVLLRLSDFERALENESLLARSLRPATQLMLTSWLGAGNERVYPGENHWLFYRQDVDYIVGHPFLEPEVMERRVDATPEWRMPPQPDPRPAIVQLRRDLEARGISLIVVPTPLKPAIHPELLARRDIDASVLHNASFELFIEDLRREGVHVFDPSQALAAAGVGGPQYLSTDTHWRPESMEAVADLLGNAILNHERLTPVEDPGYRVERLEVRNTGDIARMLDLPAGAPLFPPEAVWLRRILDADGSLWRSSRDADVLVLGDSFSNIYALESMGWGTSAGFVEQLSYVLRRPIDRLLQNDQAAFATREMLQRDPARLDGKRVVVYQFAARELMFGDWKSLPLGPGN
jgi:alginate O-acetyltransferase complex protein AlgJ